MNKCKVKHWKQILIAHLQSGFVQKQDLQSRLLLLSPWLKLITPHYPIAPTYTTLTCWSISIGFEEKVVKSTAMYNYGGTTAMFPQVFWGTPAVLRKQET